MRLVNRLTTIWRNRGPSGFARFIVSRTISHRRDMIFDAAIPEITVPPRWNGLDTFIVVSRENLKSALSAGLAEQLSQGEGAEYLEGLHGDDLLLAVVGESGDVLHHSFILFNTRTKRLLRESPETPLFAHCVTRPAARGRRLYPQTLRYGLELLAQRGHRRAIINCDPSNRASVSGIKHAGFNAVSEFSTWSLGSWLHLQMGHDWTGKRLLRIYVG